MVDLIKQKEIEILDSDFIPLEEFALNWRWIDEKRNKLPLESVRKINPLNPEKSRVIAQRHRIYLLSYGLNESVMERVESVDSPREESVLIRNWLKNRFVGESENIIVSWTEDLAVQTTRTVFCNYWSDFCYPAADDVSVSPIDITWILLYHHNERLFWGNTKKLENV